MVDSPEQRNTAVPEVEVHAHQSDDGSFELVMTDTGRMNAAPRAAEMGEGAAEYHAMDSAQARVSPRGVKRLSAIALGVLLVGGLVIYLASGGREATSGMDSARMREATDGFKPYREGSAGAAGSTLLKARDLSAERPAPPEPPTSFDSPAKPSAVDEEGVDNFPPSRPGWELDDQTAEAFDEPGEQPLAYPDKVDPGYKYEPEPEPEPELDEEFDPVPEEEFQEEEPEWEPEDEDESLEDYEEEAADAPVPAFQGTRRLIPQPTLRRSPGRLDRNIDSLAPARSNTALDRFNLNSVQRNTSVGQSAGDFAEGEGAYYPEDEPYLDEE